MKWQELGEMNCPIARSLSIFGDRWTLLIIRNSFLRTRRFDDFQKQLGITRHLLSERLTRLVEHQIFDKVQYQDAPKRYEYRLTERGLALYPILLALTNWGNDWMNDGTFAKLEYIHKPCGKKTQPMVVCSECGESLKAHDMLPLFEDVS
ncbi:MAG: helix-turn-helix transcriptional regulator [Gammaproteobacteria bacterium]|nr:helix-turn-helix transcriptional regulator [Gammaproteobacteria bacterium]